ncbi:MAG: hypothetical protein WCW40_01170 [Bacteroidota bacterium]
MRSCIDPNGIPRRMSSKPNECSESNYSRESGSLQSHLPPPGSEKHSLGEK